MALTRELANVKESLAALKRRKEKCELRRKQTTSLAVAAVARSVLEEARAGENNDNGQGIIAQQEGGSGSSGANANANAGDVSTERYFSDESYWEIRDSSDQSDLVLFLRLFRPDCKKLSKPKAEQWSFLQSNILPVSKAKMDLKEEEYRERITKINDLFSELENEASEEETDEIAND